MEDFMWVLAAAFLVLIAMFFVSFIPSAMVAQGEDVVEIHAFSVGAVGRVSQYPTGTINLGSFNVGETQTELLKAVPQMRVYTGLGGAESKEYEINVPGAFEQLASGVVISFDVSESNLYGDLVIKWNGKEFMRGKVSPRNYVVMIPKDFVKTSNNIEIYAEGPGLVFWASTMYIMKDFEVLLNYGPSKIFSFHLNQDEVESWMKGRVSFYATGTSGKSTSRLIVKVNGNEVSSVVPDGAGAVEFGYTDAPINLGDNLVTFAAQDDMIILHNVQLKLFLSTSELEKQFNFNIFDDKYSLLNSGQYKARIRFYVEDIASGGTLTMDINGNQKAIRTMSTGSNTLYISTTELKSGSNTISFSGAGSWYISKVIIELERIETE